MPNTTDQRPRGTTTHDCDPQLAVTRSLLGYGFVAGPFYVAVSLAQALTRDGFDLTRHSWSLLANGHTGWIQIANLALSGLMVIAFAVGLRRAGSERRWVPRLLTVYGASLLAAAAFRADPALGFPVGTPQDTATVTWHGALHFAAGGVGFLALAAATFVVAGTDASAGRAAFATWTRVVGVLFLAGFASIASGSGGRASNIAFTVGIVLVWTWLATFALDRYRTTAPVSTTAV
ncbi:MAG: hypothetical protein QOG52_987 [Frankiaceae bacterium]|jgi:hypothetical membrane protein|nr:hypothetical protein [Frankiaceae bacterium]